MNDDTIKLHTVNLHTYIAGQVWPSWRVQMVSGDGGQIVEYGEVTGGKTVVIDEYSYTHSVKEDLKKAKYEEDR